MASVADICNLALSHLGDSATVTSIDPPEGSAQAEHCARFYPMARDLMLESHDWAFATRRADLALTGTAPDAWEYSYARPANCIKVVGVYPEDYADDDADGVDFVEENNLIYTDAENASVRYLTRVTDTTKFPPGFVTALSWLLAHYLAGPIRKGDNKIKDFTYQMYVRMLAAAAASDASTRSVTRTHTVTWMSDRG